MAGTCDKPDPLSRTLGAALEAIQLQMSEDEIERRRYRFFVALDEYIEQRNANGAKNQAEQDVKASA